MPDHAPVCRICLTVNVSMLLIADTMQNVYEKITSTPLLTEDMRPVTACYICYAQLRKCHKLMVMSAKAEEVLTAVLNKSKLVNQQSVFMIDRKANKLCRSLVISPLECIDSPPQDVMAEVKPQSENGECNMELGTADVEKKEITDEPQSENVDRDVEFVGVEDVEKTEIKDEPQSEDVERDVEFVGVGDVEKTEIKDEPQSEDVERDVEFVGVGDVEKTEIKDEPQSENVGRDVEFVGVVDVEKTEIKDEPQSENVQIDTEFEGIGDVEKTEIKDEPQSENVEHDIEFVGVDEKTEIEDQPQSENVQIDTEFEGIGNVEKREIKDEPQLENVECNEFVATVVQQDAKSDEKTVPDETMRNTEKSAIQNQQEKRKKANKNEKRVPEKPLPNEEKPARSRKAINTDAASTQNLHIKAKGNSSKRNSHTSQNKSSGERKPRYTCDICQRWFDMPIQLKCHLMMSHVGEKPYKCHTCQSQFRRKCHLQDHVKTHTGERPFECDVCHTKFRRKYHLKKHSKTHLKDKICELHSKDFSSDKLFKCHVCQKHFITKKYLSLHLIIHEKNEKL